MTSNIGRIGIFGGSFNPLHQGHLIVAEFAAETLRLDRVFFAPVVHPPHKDGRKLQPIEHRLAMIETAIADNDRFHLTLVDVERPGPHYSVDTVKILEDMHPGSQLYFVMGGDSFRDFMRWHAPEEIVQHCRLGVMRRPSTRPMQPTMHDDVMPGLSNYVDIIEAPPIGISATRVREQIKAGKSVRYLVPNPVLAYIHKNNLYQG
ncbi:MAG: nicotinate (nicotinamide) nucleotide adenylyltransferase [Chloroflexota bacterium]